MRRRLRPVSRKTERLRDLDSRCEVRLVMIATSGIEGNATIGAPVATCQVLRNAELISADPTEHSGLAQFCLRPDFDGMVCQDLVALFAGVISAAALHLDSKNVEIGSAVSAARLSVEIDPAICGAWQQQRGSDYRMPVRSPFIQPFPWSHNHAWRPRPPSFRRLTCAPPNRLWFPRCLGTAPLARATGTPLPRSGIR